MGKRIRLFVEDPWKVGTKNVLYSFRSYTPISDRPMVDVVPFTVKRLEISITQIASFGSPFFLHPPITRFQDFLGSMANSRRNNSQWSSNEEHFANRRRCGGNSIDDETL
uniref:Uncharacterized protein n=1 Tax=Vespula pensylvanica TaxID=30213 RepID=A0A834NY21_VESPE|nr:hypothetical protein H0235_009208 [Vespula pensylvanica]